ncbi:uncharacterized protein LOC117830535 [Notolabrus celidotus]|uniref:uncharacterized protein LOC117830535 n=1 Tax=Notolabrus celidotus TaxID=1203425 RepID=UPI00148F4FE9|nr:uncharacterized protein LOC117830535 [Notolabrus celidotus]
MNPAGVLLFFSVSLCAAQRQKTPKKGELDFRNEGFRMNPAGVLLFFSVSLCAAQRQKTPKKGELDFRNEAEKGNNRACANLTLVLDNWKYAIMTQVKDLLLHDHSTVLPDYGRIQPLSDALGDLYSEFNTLKERLSELTSNFDRVESFVDDVRSGRKTSAPRGKPGAPGSLQGETGAAGTDAGGQPQRRRTRVVVRRVKIPVGSRV